MGKVFNIQSILVVHLLVSCNHLSKQERYICNDRVKYWDLVESNTNNSKYHHGYCFLNNGKYQYFHYLNNLRFEEKTNDVILNYKWSLTNDTSMFIEDVKVRIFKLTDDSLIFQWSDKSIVRLIKSKEQTTTVKPELKTKFKITYDTIIDSSGQHYRKTITPIHPIFKQKAISFKTKK